MLNSEIVQYILPYVKSLKIKRVNDFEAKVLVYYDKLICTDADNSILYVMNIVNTEKVIAGHLDDLIANPDNINYRLLQELMVYYNYYTSIKWSCTKTELELDDSFMSAVMCKSGDGLQKYKMDNNYFLPIIYGLIPAAKGDKINYNYTEDNMFMYVKYTLFKKKFKLAPIDIYVKMLKQW